jgi:ABC-type antimicrobial peptide transport system permease subunit
MNHGISRRMIVLFVVLLLTSLIATSVTAMGLALREAQRESRQEELRKMGCDVVDVQCASRVIAELREKSSLAMYRSVGLGLVYGGGILPTDTMMDVMMKGFLQAGEFPYTTSVPSDGSNRAVGATSVFSPTDFAAMRRIPGVRNLWFKTFGNSLLTLPVSGRQRIVPNLPMSPGQLTLWNFVIERGRDFAPGDGPNDVIIGRTLADLLFPGGDPVSQTFFDGIQDLHVIGVLARKEEGLASSSGFVYPYSDPNSTVFQYSPSVPVGQEEDTPMVEILAEPGTGPGVAKAVQRMFRSKENADTIVTATSRNSMVPSVVGLTVRTRTLTLLTSYALLTLVGCLLAVAVSLYTEFATRVRAIAVRRALGTSRRSVTLGFMAEACLVAAASWGVASLVLLTLARPWTRLLQTLLQSGAVDIINQSRSAAVASTGTGYLDITLRLSPLAFLASLALLLIIAVLSSLIPARGISRINPGAGIRFRGGVRSRFDALKLDLWGSFAVALCLLFALLPLSELSFGLKRDREFALLLGRNVARISTSSSTPLTAKQLQLIKDRLTQAGHPVAELRNAEISWTSADGDPRQWIRVMSGDAALPAFYGLTPVHGTGMGSSAETAGLEALAGPDVWTMLDKIPNQGEGNLGSAFLSSGVVQIVGQFGPTVSATMNRTLFTTLDTRTSMCQSCGMRTTLLVGGVTLGTLQDVQDIVRSSVPDAIYSSLGFLDGGALVAAIDTSIQALAGFLMLFAAFGLLEGFIVFANQLYLYAQLKRRDTAVRKALGTSQAQLARLHLSHNVLVAGISVVIGTLLMVLTATLTERPSYALTATSLPWLAVTCLLALIVSFIAARNQARRSRNVVPSRELRNL